MRDNIILIPECYADTALLKVVYKISGDKVAHAEGIHRVARRMEKESQRGNYNRIMIGLVDNDKKNIPRYFDNFKTLEEAEGIIFKHKPETNHYLIIICPEFEKWVLDSAAAVGIAVKNFNVPTDPKALHNITKLTSVAKNENLMSLLRELKKKQAPSFKKLEEILKKFI